MRSRTGELTDDCSDETLAPPASLLEQLCYGAELAVRTPIRRWQDGPRGAPGEPIMAPAPFDTAG